MALRVRATMEMILDPGGQSPRNHCVTNLVIGRGINFNIVHHVSRYVSVPPQVGLLGVRSIKPKDLVSLLGCIISWGEGVIYCTITLNHVLT